MIDTPNKKSYKKENITMNKTSNKNKRTKESVIPKEVANRMARRIAFTTGIPTLLGMGVFVLSYFSG